MRLDLFPHSATLEMTKYAASCQLRLDLFPHSATLDISGQPLDAKLRLDLFPHSATLFQVSSNGFLVLRLDLFPHSATLHPTKPPENAGEIVEFGWEKGGFEGVFWENHSVFLSEKA